jgi:hypothetical protein
METGLIQEGLFSLEGNVNKFRTSLQELLQKISVKSEEEHRRFIGSETNGDSNTGSEDRLLPAKNLCGMEEELQEESTEGGAEVGGGNAGAERGGDVRRGVPGVLPALHGGGALPVAAGALHEGGHGAVQRVAEFYGRRGLSQSSREKILKGFMVIEMEDGIRYFKENFDIDLRDPFKNVACIDNLELKPADIFRLAPSIFLNDSIINFYVRILARFITPKANLDDFHYFNTYLFSKLRDSFDKILNSSKMKMDAENRKALQSETAPIHSKIKSVFSRV